MTAHTTLAISACLQQTNLLSRFFPKAKRRWRCRKWTLWEHSNVQYLSESLEGSWFLAPAPPNDWWPPACFSSTNTSMSCKQRKAPIHWDWRHPLLRRGPHNNCSCECAQNFVWLIFSNQAFQDLSLIISRTGKQNLTWNIQHLWTGTKHAAQIVGPLTKLLWHETFANVQLLTTICAFQLV